jgi:hypothetical protein
MRQNFFEVIGMADVERVHSQMIAWIFESMVLGTKQKSDILSQLTGQPGGYVIRQVSTEHDHIDVIVETEAAVIAIENKIKITEHDQQLDRYAKSLADREVPLVHVYLSLLPEDIANPLWRVRSYRQFHSALARHAFASPANFDQYAFNEYVEAVGHLVDVVELFDEDHRGFPNVFTEGSLTKAEKRVRIASYTTPQNYVRANQLETPLQRHFLRKIRSQIPQLPPVSQVSETRGVALLNIVIAARSVEGIVFDWGVQFQGNTVKLNCYAREYAKSKFEQLPPPN